MHRCDPVSCLPGYAFYARPEALRPTGRISFFIAGPPAGIPIRDGLRDKKSI
jgi:hypothetical protein